MLEMIKQEALQLDPVLGCYEACEFSNTLWYEAVIHKWGEGMVGMCVKLSAGLCSNVIICMSNCVRVVVN